MPTTPPADPTAFRFAAEAPPTLTPGQADAGRPRTFSGVAYSGEVIPHHFAWGDLVIDLDSLSLPDQCPTLLEHDRSRRVGVCALTVRDGALVAEGRLLGNEQARALAADADDGFPWQMSVHADPSRIEKVAEGSGAHINGRTLPGPLTIFRGTRIRELSFTPSGYDHRTEARVFGAPIEEIPMSDVTAPTDLAIQITDLQSQLAALTTRAEVAEQALASAAPAELIASLQGQIAQLTAEAQGRRKQEVLTVALSDGRLLAGTPLYAHAAGLELSALEGLVASLTPIGALTGTQTGGQAPAGTGGFDAALAAEFGDEATYLAYQRAQAAGRVKIANTLTTEE